MTAVRNPIKLSDSPSDVTRSPLLGEHTDEILAEVLGMSADDISAAKSDSAVGDEMASSKVAAE